MTRKPLLPFLAAFVLSLTFFSCIQEDSGIDSFFEFQGELVPNEAVTQGTGLPLVAQLLEVEYTTADQQVFADQLGHIEMSFANCSDAWCAAAVDDCGTESAVSFNFTESEGAKAISFKDFARSPAISHWAEENVDYAFVRDGAAIAFTCAGCKGTTPFGRAYSSLTVKARAIR